MHKVDPYQTAINYEWQRTNHVHISQRVVYKYAWFDFHRMAICRYQQMIFNPTKDSHSLLHQPFKWFWNCSVLIWLHNLLLWLIIYIYPYSRLVHWHMGGTIITMMTSSNGNIFRVTGPLCGEFTGPGEFPTQRPVTRSFGVFFDQRLNKRLSKQSLGWWLETIWCPFWRHRNDPDVSKITLKDMGIIDPTKPQQNT